MNNARSGYTAYSLKIFTVIEEHLQSVPVLLSWKWMNNDTRILVNFDDIAVFKEQSLAGWPQVLQTRLWFSGRSKVIDSPILTL